jgi:hypothetical protein
MSKNHNQNRGQVNVPQPALAMQTQLPQPTSRPLPQTGGRQGWTPVNQQPSSAPVPTGQAPASPPEPAPPTRPPVQPSPEPVTLVNDPPREGDPVPCCGLPVQYQTQTSVSAAILQGPNVLKPDLWDLTIFHRGTGMPSTRVGVAFSRELRVGAWSFLPDWRWLPPEKPTAKPTTTQEPPRSPAPAQTPAGSHGTPPGPAQTAAA